MKFLVLLLFCFNVCKAQYVVTSAGEFAGVLQNVNAGETIIWKNGTYHDLKINFKPTSSGTADAKICLKAETPGKVILKGNSQMFISGAYLQAEGFLFEGSSSLDSGENVINFTEKGKNNHQTNNSKVTNCAVVYYNVATPTVENKWAALYGTHNELSYCSFIGKNNLGATAVIIYQKEKGFKEGDTTCPSARHIIHHNYFGDRTMPGDNDGEHLRIGDSKTSFTRGYNLVEWNYFEGHRNEPEVISNKSCFNIYRFNSFINCDGALTLRHGNNCLVYGNYLNGEGSAASGGIRIIGENHLVLNNCIENVQGAVSNPLKAAISLMCGMEGTPINGYFQPKNVIIAYNIIINCQNPCIAIGAINKTRKSKWLPPQNIVLANNIVNSHKGSTDFFKEEYEAGYKLLQNNLIIGWAKTLPKGFKNYDQKEEGQDKALFGLIVTQLKRLQANLSFQNLMHYDKRWKVDKIATGARWKLETNGKTGHIR